MAFLGRIEEVYMIVWKDEHPINQLNLVVGLSSYSRPVHTKVLANYISNAGYYVLPVIWVTIVTSSNANQCHGSQLQELWCHPLVSYLCG